jgi:hypothetical protein
MGIRENNNGVGVGGVWGTPPAALQEHQAEQPAAGDSKQRPLLRRSRCLPRLSRSVGLTA